MAELANFPPHVIASAREKALELEEFQDVSPQETAGEGDTEGPEAKRRCLHKQVRTGLHMSGFVLVLFDIYQCCGFINGCDDWNLQVRLYA